MSDIVSPAVHSERMRKPVVRTTEAAEAEALLARGGSLLRYSYEMALDLRIEELPEARPVPRGLTLAAIDRPAAELAAAAETAFPPDHADSAIWAEMNRVSYWEELLSGRVTGPILPRCSRLLVRPQGTVVGAVMVTLMEASDWWSGGPWIPEMFVVPRWQGKGLGGLLLSFVINRCAASGHPRIGLTVSDTNPAKGFYQRFGFRPFLTRWAVEAP